MRELLQKHTIENRFNAVITNDANNNKRLFENLIKWLKNDSKAVELIYNVNFDYEINLNRFNNENMQYIFCLAYVLQLVFKTLLDHI